MIDHELLAFELAELVRPSSWATAAGLQQLMVGETTSWDCVARAYSGIEYRRAVSDTTGRRTQVDLGRLCGCSSV